MVRITSWIFGVFIPFSSNIIFEESEGPSLKIVLGWAQALQSQSQSQSTLTVGNLKIKNKINT